MIINIGDDILRLSSLGLLNSLLADKTTKKNLMWATDAYRELGEDYERDQEMRGDLISGQKAGIIKTRAQKAAGKKSERTKQHAEVFTPLWIVQRMNDYADEVWFSRGNVFFNGATPTAEIEFPPDKPWQTYVDSRRLEITCGEAPYLTTRYDVETGELIPVENRMGILDRKLRVVTENTQTEADWFKWAIRALESTYGYEFQGDNVLIARLNVLATFEEYFAARWQKLLNSSQFQRAINIVVWNIWQMDGLTRTIPYCRGHEKISQLTFYDLLDLEERIQVMAQTQPRCIIYNWRAREPKEFTTIKAGEKRMKFDFIIGNPPYQEKSRGANANDTPVYHWFYTAALDLSDKVELITPARFLFNAGGTPQDWNKKMLEDPHLKVLWYEPNSSSVFSNADIKGGVAVTYYDRSEDFGSIGVFTAYPELNSIRQKVSANFSGSLSDVITNRGIYRYSDKAYEEQPEEMKKTADRRIAPSAFDRMPLLFTEQKPDDGHEYVQILGNIGNERVYRWFRKDYISEVENLYKYKVLVPKANGSGAIGEVLSTPLIGSPLIGFTETYISIGETNKLQEAEATLKYVKTKFARTMLGILKVTQNNAKPTWRYVPLQDFTANSDIDWSKSVAEIDRQLYAKYGLDDNEIAFIESHVKEMK